MTDRSRPHRRVQGAFSRNRLVAIAIMCAACGWIAFFFDLPVARLMQNDVLPGDIRKLFDFPEVAGHGLGVGLLIIGVAALDPTLWRRSAGQVWFPSASFLRFFFATYSGALVVNILKLLVIRVRPRSIDLASLSSPLDTFGQLAACFSGASGSDLMRFPSGHSAVAAGFAAALCHRYPHARWYFITVAVGAMFQRIVSSAHYPSDVCWGAAIGLLGAAACLSQPIDKSVLQTS